MINAPITDLRTIQECLKFSQNAASKVGQKYSITTYDLGVCMKAFPLIWNEQKKTLYFLGHFIFAELTLKVLYCQGSGWLEAKLITTGSVSGVTDGKHWDRALNTHKSMLEAMERLLNEKYLETHEPLSQKKLGIT